MSFFEDASLVLIPSAQKTSKVYSVKPTDGSGDLTFSRSNDTATRVNSAGLIEKVRTNVALYSNDFSNAAWAKLANASVSGTRVTDPFGGNTAWQIIFDGTANGRLEQTVGGATIGNVYTFSIWLRVASGTQSVGIGGGATESIITVTTTWQRFTSTSAASFADVYPRVRCDSAVTIQAYGAQIELSDFGATPYIATTSAAVSVGPVANVPRLDYLNSSCPRLLLEPQRTNLVKYSEQFDNAVWNKDPATTTITANNAVSPDGYTNADLFGSSSPSAQAGVYQTILGLTPAATYYISAYVKLGTATNVCITVNNTVAWNTVGGQSFSAANGLNTNTWTRVGFSFTAPAGANINYHIGQHQQSGVDPQSLGTFLVWGAQVEAGAYATSYIPTLGAASTRGSDACSKTGISSLIGQTEGTIFYDFVFKTGANTTDGQFGISTAAGNDRVIVWNNFSLSALGLQIKANSTNVINNVSLGTFVDGTTYKMAVAYKSGSTAVYVNGTQVYTSSTTFTFAASLTDFIVGAYGTSGFNAHQKVNQAILFPTRLSNSDLAALTA